MKHELENISFCPVCGEKRFKDVLRAVDHNYSGDKFKIVCCKNCGFKFTNPRPIEASISQYYKSENYISHTSSNKGIFNKAYLAVRNYQFRNKLKIINSLSTNKNKNILDIGCGTGDFLSFCSENGWVSRGVEVDKEARSLANERNNTAVEKSIDFIIEKKEKFDVITLWHVLEHIYDINQYLKKIKLLLKDGGHVILGLPNHKSYDSTHFKENWYAYDVPIHVSHFSRKDIQVLSGKHKLKYVKDLPLIFDAYYISLLSSKKSGQNLLSALYIGWLSNMKARKNKEFSSIMYILAK